MYVYDWPISAKVASIGWSSRRTSVEDKHGVARALKVGLDGIRSFVEVLSGNQKSSVDVDAKGVEKVLDMSWNNYNNEDEWLSRCAVGVLKEFINVSSVNIWLRSRGLSFSSTFLGDKSVLWVFECEGERDSFINNRFFWDDRFISMSKWSESSNTQARLMWIDCVGVPLRFLNEAFFLKIGWQVGKPLMVDEETLNKKRFDRGRILVLIPLNQVCPCRIKVSVGSGSFCVKISEEPAPVDSSWPASILGLQTVFSKPVVKAVPVTVSLPEQVRHEDVGSSLCVTQEEKDMGRLESIGQSKTEGRQSVNHSLCELIDEEVGERFLDSCTPNNQKVVEHLKPKLNSFEIARQIGSKAGDCSFSNKGIGLAVTSCFARLSLEKRGVSADVDVVEGESVMRKGYCRSASQSTGKVVGPKSETKSGGMDLDTNMVTGNNSSKEVSKVKKPNGDFLEMHSSAGLITIPMEWGGYDEINIFSKRRNGRESGLSAKGHGMKTRSSNINYKMPWYLKEEISKFIDIGIALGVDFNDKKVRLADIVAKAYSKLRRVKL
ncbi:hypothetical protein Q3G72_007620 [Acer saccharum]|nr:hypothetical protein Q3G72_007620 [Acer saccharum]